MNSTKNTKGNRKVVVATFSVPEAVFLIPDGLDLEDKSIVKTWFVRWNTLHIEYVTGVEEEIQYHYEPQINCKYPDTTIEDASDNGICFSEDEEDYDEEIQEYRFINFEQRVMGVPKRKHWYFSRKWVVKHGSLATKRKCMPDSMTNVVASNRSLKLSKKDTKSYMLNSMASAQQSKKLLHQKKRISV